MIITHFHPRRLNVLSIYFFPIEGRYMKNVNSLICRLFCLVAFCLITVAGVFCWPGEAGSQSPFQGVPQAPVPPMPRQMAPQRAPAAPPQQMPSEYAYRPDLSNPEFGECLQLEKNWKTIWNSYYQAYYHAQRMSPSDPQYPQMAAYVNNLRYQLDAAWSNFSQKCIYFPKR